MQPVPAAAAAPVPVAPMHALQLLQVASHMRRAGMFVVVAVTRPFDFEGRRKVEEASALVEALQDVANLVVRLLLGLGYKPVPFSFPPPPPTPPLMLSFVPLPLTQAFMGTCTCSP